MNRHKGLGKLILELLCPDGIVVGKGYGCCQQRTLSGGHPNMNQLGFDTKRTQETEQTRLIVCLVCAAALTTLLITPLFLSFFP